MFIRKTKKLDPKTKKPYYNFQLIESIRTERGPRQRILLNLGADVGLDPQECKLLANRIEMIVTGEETFLLPSEKIENLAQKYASRLIRNLSAKTEKVSPTKSVPDLQTIDLQSISHKEARTIGAEHLLTNVASDLKLSNYFKRLGLTPREVALALGTIIARAIYPASERATFMWLQNNSALGELLHFDFTATSLKKLYKISDLLLENKEELENYLSTKQRSFHGINSTMILYDLTNTYMEGRAEMNHKAKHGLSKEKRTDCPLVTLGLVVDEHGFPIRSRILEGNISEAKTLQEAVEILNDSEDLIKPTLVMDAGIATEENLLWLKEHGYHYIVCARQNPPTKERTEEYTLVGSDSQVKVARLHTEEPQDQWLVCHSSAKEKTASSMKTLFQQRLEEDLIKLHQNLSRPRRRKKYDKVLERIGRIRQKHKKISGCYKIEVVPSSDQKTAVAIEWSPIPKKLNERLVGEYYLRTNLNGKSAKDLWYIYNTLRRIEDSFRFMKSSLGMRPIYHQKAKRVDGHLWITILAYYLIQDIVYRLRKSGIKLCWPSVRTLMSSRMRVTTQVRTNQDKMLYIRSTTDPEGEQQEIYDALDLPSQILGTRKTSF